MMVTIPIMVAQTLTTTPLQNGDLTFHLKLVAYTPDGFDHLGGFFGCAAQFFP